MSEESTIPATSTPEAAPVAPAPAPTSIRIPGTDKVQTISKPPEPPKVDLDPPPVTRDPISQNSRNAEKRINRTNQKLRDRIAQLEASLAQIDHEDPQNTAAIVQAETQLATYSDIVDNSYTEDFESRAQEAFGDGSAEFMRQTYRYAKHVNNKEPELASYIEAPFGMILLREWYKRMDDPTARQEWLRLDPYRKGKILDNFYSQIVSVANDVAAGQTAGSARNIPAARGGRQSNDGVPTDDFGIALQQAQTMFNRQR